jgi:hypothetical protein
MMGNVQLLIGGAIFASLFGAGIGSLVAHSDSPAPVVRGPQLVGTPVTSSGLRNQLALPTINVDPGEALMICTKAPSPVSVPVTDDQSNAWQEITSVASGSSNSIHVSLAMTPLAGLTNVHVKD